MGVIQGCPASPTVFGMIIHDLFWSSEQLNLGVTIGGVQIPLLLFADDKCSKIRQRLSKALVQPVVLYGAPSLGPALSRTNWRKIESIQKKFLQHELGVRTQVPYAILLAEVGMLSLEAEALLLAIQYTVRVRGQEDNRYSKQAWISSKSSGCGTDLACWSAFWGIEEKDWEPLISLRTRVADSVIQKLWEDPTPRQAYYCRDIFRLTPYTEHAYLTSDLSPHLQRLVACYRTSSHSLRVEEGRWTGIPWEQRMCKLFTLGQIETEHHVFLKCPQYSLLREQHEISFHDLRDFFLVSPIRLGSYILAVDKAQQLALEQLVGPTDDPPT
ncbi:hypothetical protein R1sor_026047 [Riccia sorocarpa]|uniref:Reverse transcriptase domain-containing protein n=1 Tax=Riccia sorocarpa TaxID=122646 RepID=A0ABD3GFZ1_9MARC